MENFSSFFFISYKYSASASVFTEWSANNVGLRWQRYRFLFHLVYAVEVNYFLIRAAVCLDLHIIIWILYMITFLLIYLSLTKFSFGIMVKEKNHNRYS